MHDFDRKQNQKISWEKLKNTVKVKNYNSKFLNKSDDRKFQTEEYLFMNIYELFCISALYSLQFYILRSS